MTTKLFLNNKVLRGSRSSGAKGQTLPCPVCGEYHGQPDSVRIRTCNIHNPEITVREVKHCKCGAFLAVKIPIFSPNKFGWEWKVVGWERGTGYEVREGSKYYVG
jgi:hypothetical protein